MTDQEKSILDSTEKVSRRKFERELIDALGEISKQIKNHSAMVDVWGRAIKDRIDHVETVLQEIADKLDS